MTLYLSLGDSVAKITWAGGRNLGKLEIELKERVQGLKQAAIEALEMTVDEGAEETVNNLEAATTKTGRKRAQGGAMALGGADRFPGRHETGNMVHSVRSEVRDESSDVVWGVFGWWGDQYEEYFRDQDLGEGNIPAARALPQAAAFARQQFEERMRAVIDGKTVS